MADIRSSPGTRKDDAPRIAWDVESPVVSMKGHFRSLRSWLGAAILLTALPVAGHSNAVLNVDGIVRVKELPFQGTRLVMMEHDGPTEIVDRGLDHFYRSLPLGSNFLLAFERAGCVTKQLYFDTHVPAEAMALAPFSFPFKVTLEPPEGRVFEYAGPVGYVRYYPERKDFGYDTDYTTIAHPVLVDRMLNFKNAEQLPGATLAPDHRPHAIIGATVHVDEGQELDDLSNEVVTAQLPGNRPLPMGQVAQTTSGPELAPAIITSAAQDASTDELPRASPMEEVHASIMQVDEHHKPPTVVMTRSLTAATSTATTHADPTPISSSTDTERIEELIVEKLRVTKIIRFMAGGQATEYRKVQHLYGAVYYFKNGGICSEETFQREAMAR